MTRLMQMTSIATNSALEESGTLTTCSSMPVAFSRHTLSLTFSTYIYSKRTPTAALFGSLTNPPAAHLGAAQGERGLRGRAETGVGKEGTKAHVMVVVMGAWTTLRR